MSQLVYIVEYDVVIKNVGLYMLYTAWAHFIIFE